MYRTKKLVLLFFILTISLLSQERKTFTFSADNSFLLKELTAVVQEDEGKIYFEMIPPQVLAQEKFKDLDLQKGDEILYINKTKVNSLEDLHTAYESIETGQEIELGIKRGEERFFASLMKEDKAEGGKVMMMDAGGGSFESKDGKIMMDGKSINLDSLKKAGKLQMIPQKKKKDDE